MNRLNKSALSAVKVRLLIEYDGGPFSGFQLQGTVRTVQLELEHAVKVVLQQLAKTQMKDVVATPNISASGRTDAGVHARRQVVGFSWPSTFSDVICDEFQRERIRRSLDGITSPEISILSLELAENNFDPRKNVKEKQYSYHIIQRIGSSGLSRKRAWWVRAPLNIEKMVLAAKMFVGTHDFSSFRAKDCGRENAVRTVTLSEFVRTCDDTFIYLIRGQGFLKQMVRIIVGTLVDVGKGRLAIDDLPSIFEAKDRRKASRTAPAHGLFLDWVKYQ